MGLTLRGMFENIFGKQKKDQGGKGTFYRTLNAYTPAFTTWDGQLYENELIRAAVDTIARHIMKLSVDATGTAKPKLRASIRPGPNDFQTWSQFLYRMTTILLMQTNSIIIPTLDDDLNTTGYFSVLPSETEVLDVGGEPWLKFRFNAGETGYMEMRRCGIMTRFQYKDDLFGSGNQALNTTMQLLHMKDEGIQEGIRNSATFRFMARATNFADAEDLKKEMQRFNRTTLRGESGGLLLFPTDYSDVKQIEQKPYNVDADQVKLIQDNVFNYFGVNEKVLRNEAVGDDWAAFYDGALEPIVVQLSEVLTRMTFSRREIANGNQIIISGNRLQYASTQEKLNVSAQMADRGIMNRNEIREIWGLPRIEGPTGDMFLVRGEYKDADTAAEDQTMNLDGGTGGAT